MIEKVYFWIKLSLKTTFDILLSHKINVQQGFMSVYKNLCMQNAIWYLEQNCVHNMNK
jgi:hypothetical protein